MEFLSSIFSVVFLLIPGTLLFSVERWGGEEFAPNSPNQTDCGLEMNGSPFPVHFPYLMLVNTVEVHVISVVGEGPCTLRLLAVGGGGYGNFAGGGSGYVQSRSLQVDKGTVISAKVGDSGEPSSVTVEDIGTTVANRGEDGKGEPGDYTNSFGGSGYSGGGDFGGSYEGGADGGNGEGDGGGLHW